MTIHAKMTNTGTRLVDSQGHESGVAAQEAVVSVLSAQFTHHEHIAQHEAVGDE